MLLLAYTAVLHHIIFQTTNANVNDMSSLLLTLHLHGIN